VRFQFRIIWRAHGTQIATQSPPVTSTVSDGSTAVDLMQYRPPGKDIDQNQVTNRFGEN
jgi:hypothetical protein